MKPSNWDRIQELYHAALALPEAERETHVEKQCAGDEDLFRLLKSLLKAHGSAGVLDEPVGNLHVVPGNMVGEIICNRYRLESELGRSAMSRVYLAADLSVQEQLVVIKILSEELANDLEARRRFDKEVEALVRIEHPGVIKVQDRGELPDGRPYIVMPYVKGDTLRSQISKQGMDLDRAASILKEVGDALHHAHQQEVFHRDLKPENIMLRRDTDAVVLIDFGIAKVRKSLVAPNTVSGAAAGTLVYMAPEQLRGEEVMAATDIYSMAVVAYEMVTGQLPFNAETPAQLAEMQRKEVRIRPMYLREALPVQADRMITRALRFDPQRRFDHAGVFGEKLASALRVTRQPWRIPVWAKVVASVIVLAVLSYGVLRYVDRRHDIKPPSRSFTYWLLVQRMRDGNAYQAPFKSNGEDTFESGDEFQLNVSGDEPGYLYIFREEPAQSKNASFTMLYPRADSNGGVPTLGANQSFQSEWMTFSGPAGDENFWIVWSVSPVAQLDSATPETLQHAHSGITGEKLVAIKEFLKAKQDESDVRVFHYKADQRAVARGKSEFLIALAQFKHR